MQATGILCIKGRLFVVSFTTSELSQKLRFTQSFCFFEISETDCTTLKIHPSISRNTANVYQITHAMTGSMRFDSFIHLFLAAKQTSCMFLSLYEVVQQLFFKLCWHPPPQGVCTGVFLKELSYNTHWITKSWLAWEHLAILDNLSTYIVITKGDTTVNNVTFK